jgi:DNA-binding response OmpR family regulator
MDQPILLLVDDDVELVEMMREFLEPEGFTVEVAHNGATFRAAAPAADLIILDVMLPGGSGFELLKEFRTRSAVPVIMLTAKDNDIDRVVGLEIGADDYVSKPFNPRELVARVRAVLRRTGSESKLASKFPPTQPGVPSTGSWITVGDVVLDPASRMARCRVQLLDLTSAEFNLLEFFLRKAGRVVSRDELSMAAFGRQDVTKIDRNVDTLVSKLRRKLDPDEVIEFRIKTVRNAGYIYTVTAHKAP